MKKTVLQSALGTPRHSGVDTDPRWNRFAMHVGVVCAVYDRGASARVKLFNVATAEIDHVPVARGISVVTGDRVLVAWIGGNEQNPRIVGLDDTRTLEQSSTTKRPMADLVPLPTGNGLEGRHVREHPIAVETPTELATDAYASMINWEAHGRDGLRYEVMGQEMPDPLKPIGNLPAAFQRLYHTIVTDPAGMTAWDQYPAKDGAEAWRVATAVSESGDLELRIQHGGYRAGSVQDWAGDDDATLTVLLTDAGELTIKRGELELTYDDESGTLTVRAEKVVLESDDVRMAQGDRPVLVREPGATLPPGITEATEVQV